MTETVRQMLAVAMRMAPNSGVVGDMQALAQSLEMAGETEARQVEILAQALLDGLKHGNWPQQFAP